MKALNCTHCELMIETIVASEGCYLYDDKGKQYIDYESGVWCTSIGHNNPDVNQAICNQVQRISHVGYRYSCDIVEMAAGMILDILHIANGKTVFLSSGSEAVEFAVQAARKIRSKTKPYILHLNQFFLSSYGQSSLRPDDEWISLDLSDMDTKVWRSEIDRLPFDKIGVFVFEPGNASGLVRLPSKDIVSYIASRIKQAGGLIVVDEVTTGVGRTGKWFGFEHYDILPDLIACGKGIGNGYPVSCVVMRDSIADSLLENGFHYAQSHQNDPLGCSVICSVLSQITNRNLIEHAAEMGEYFLTQLNTLVESSSALKEVRGRGLMIAVELSAEAPIEKIHRDLLKNGYIVGTNVTSRVLRLYPPLIIERQMIDKFMRSFGSVLSCYA